MKDKFYRNRMIFRIVMYLVFYGAFFIRHLYRHQFMWRYSFQGLNGLSFIIYGAMAISFITTAIMVVSLIWEIIAKKGGKHIFTIVQLVIAAAVNVIFCVHFHTGELYNIPTSPRYPALDFIVWICWLAEFIVRKIKSKKESDLSRIVSGIDKKP